MDEENAVELISKESALNFTNEIVANDFVINEHAQGDKSNPSAEEDNRVYTSYGAMDASSHSVGRVESDEANEVLLGAWLHELQEASLPEFHGNIAVPDHGTAPWWKAIQSYIGPGALVAVGYMDPGNWSTDIAAGSQFNYNLLFIVLLSSLMAMFLQILALKAGFATGRDLAQICRDSYPQPVVYMLWIIAEVAIIATDIAEVLGSAIALKLLFGLPLIIGVCLTALDIILFLLLSGSKFHLVEIFVAGLILIITVSFAVQLGISQPLAGPLLLGFLPSTGLVTDKQQLFLSVGIIGATVMPHNLFLHSSIVLTRGVQRTEPAIREAIHFASVDSTVSLFIAFFVNAAILIVAAATFYKSGYHSVAALEDAYKLLEPLLKSQAAPILFGVALLASGQNSTLTGTLSGQIVMEGFTTWKIRPFVRRMSTRFLAIIPAVIAVAIGGDQSANYLLILSQVILGYALPFAIVPLVHITSSQSRMGSFVSGPVMTIIAVLISVLIIGMNILLLASS